MRRQESQKMMKWSSKYLQHFNGMIVLNMSSEQRICEKKSRKRKKKVLFYISICSLNFILSVLKNVFKDTRPFKSLYVFIKLVSLLTKAEFDQKYGNIVKYYYSLH